MIFISERRVEYKKAGPPRFEHGSMGVFVANKASSKPIRISWLPYEPTGKY